ncbi:MAG: PLP-dependent transferase [Rhodococcus sp. (in: high G+C Gram-positive bacteria)]|uniref:PLP-dependent transferase n=1 Tax=Rhodococcus sp. EPR-157 TaxID=1813677 RepID=UPI001E54B62D|nr:PLP-dependent transferase [Rhodococcus sp. EPR-157]
MSGRSFGLRTRAIHAGVRPDPSTCSRAVPIYSTAGYVFENAADAGDLFALQKYGNVYSRIARVGRRVRSVRLGQREVPAHDRTRRVVWWPVVVGQFRGIRLLDEASQ